MAKSKKVKPVSVVVAVLDETGSMSIRMGETITAYNVYLDGLREANDTQIFIQTLKFDRYGTEPTVRFLYPAFAVPIREATALSVENYSPRGNTPLYDAIGQGIGVAEQIARQQNTSRVTLMIQTDGMENASSQFGFHRIKELIAAKQAMGWQIIFLAADLGKSGYDMAAGIGVHVNSTMSYTGGLSQNAFASAAGATRNYGVTGQSTGFSSEEKAKAGDTDAT